jgi:hypothetical protein
MCEYNAGAGIVTRVAGQAWSLSAHSSPFQITCSDCFLHSQSPEVCCRNVAAYWVLPKPTHTLEETFWERRYSTGQCKAQLRGADWVTSTVTIFLKLHMKNTGTNSAQQWSSKYMQHNGKGKVWFHLQRSFLVQLLWISVRRWLSSSPPLCKLLLTM